MVKSEGNNLCKCLVYGRYILNYDFFFLFLVVDLDFGVFLGEFYMWFLSWYRVFFLGYWGFKEKGKDGEVDIFLWFNLGVF